MDRSSIQWDSVRKALPALHFAASQSPPWQGLTMIGVAPPGHGIFLGEPLRLICAYPAGLIRAAGGALLYPLKRSFEPAMGTLILRYGDAGNRENYSYAEAGDKPVTRLAEKFVATRNGQLFVYFNKPAFGFGWNILRNYNSGIAKIKIVRIPPKE